VPAVNHLVTIGLPVRNGARYLEQAVRSVLDQSYGQLELVISDNASDDATEEICRGFARSDPRVRYIRQADNIGLVGNFNATLNQARGAYVKWLGADDWLSPTYLSRCVEVLDDDASLALVTTQQGHVRPDGVVETAGYDATPMRSPQPVERFTEMLRLLNESHLLLDPMYGTVRRAIAARLLPLPVMLLTDQVLAARLALAGPFGHLREVLSYRREAPFPRAHALADKFGVPRWRASVATVLQCRELAIAVRDAELGPDERRRADAAIARMFLRRQRLTAVHRTRKLAGLVLRPAATTLRRPGSAEGR
jgi:glycosyltransferase involved in cell wall biosynthesis